MKAVTAGIRAKRGVSCLFALLDPSRQHGARELAGARRGSGLAGQLGAALLADTVTYHTEPTEAADLARSAGVRMLVLSHLTQAGMPGFPETFINGIEDGGELDWRLAEDGMTLELPIGGTEIKVSD